MAESSPRPRSRLMDRHTVDYDERVQERRGELAETKRQEARTARYRVINQKRSGYSTPDTKLPPKVKYVAVLYVDGCVIQFWRRELVVNIALSIGRPKRLRLRRSWTCSRCTTPSKRMSPRPRSKCKSGMCAEVIRVAAYLMSHIYINFASFFSFTMNSAQEAEEADIMCNFLPMVREYLTSMCVCEWLMISCCLWRCSVTRSDHFPQTLDLPVSDNKVDPKITVDEATVGGRLSSASNRRDDAGGASDSEDEYVYDIYYRDVNADHAKESQQRAIGSL